MNILSSINGKPDRNRIHYICDATGNIVSYAAGNLCGALQNEFAKINSIFSFLQFCLYSTCLTLTSLLSPLIFLLFAIFKAHLKP